VIRPTHARYLLVMQRWPVRHPAPAFSPSKTTWLTRLDARDRALLVRVALRPTGRVLPRVFWRAVTHAGGARASIGACLASLALPQVTLAMAWSTLLLLGVSHAVVQIVKRFVGRPRPVAGAALPSLVDVPDRFS
jgi:undecaprenyl-diphosphatase